MTTAAEVVEVARSYVGVPFRHQGRNRQGVDCVGLVVATMRELHALPEGFVDVTHYGPQPTRGELDAIVAQYCTPLEAAAPGALVGVRWKKEFAHVAICGGATLIHAYSWRGQVVEHGFRDRWRTLAFGAWALPGVTYG